MDTHEFVPWIEQCVYQIGRSTTDWSRSGEATHVLDALAAAETCVELLRELKRRVDG